MIGWGICIATLDRPDVLRRTIAHRLLGGDVEL